MTREEAIEVYNGLINTKIKEAFEFFAPELREINEEEIRKDIIGGLMWQRDNLKSEGPHDNNLILPGFCLAVGKHLAYLEKQKEPTTEELYAEAGTTEKEYIANTMKMVRAMRERKKEQKPVEKQDYSGLTDPERAIHRGFLSAGVENVPVTIIKETAKECLAQIVSKNSVKFEEGFKAGRESGLRDGQKYVLNNLDSYGLCKPAEWSADDKLMRAVIIQTLETLGGRGTTRMQIEWLKSLRPQPKKGLHPGSIRKVDNPMKWMEEDEKEREQKPVTWSEEDETHLGWIIECFVSWKYQVPEFADQYQSAIDFLKSLRPSWKPSEEQMSALLWCIAHLGGADRRVLAELYEHLKMYCK